MLLLWVPILLASVSALPLSQVSSSPRHICDFEDAFRSKLHHGWTFAAAPTFTQRTRRIGHAFRFSSSRIIYLSRMFLFLHKVHSKKQRVLSSTNMDLLLRNDAYGQCELYEGHLVQVIFAFIFITTIGALAVMSPTHIANIWNQFKQC